MTLEEQAVLSRMTNKILQHKERKNVSGELIGRDPKMAYFVLTVEDVANVINEMYAEMCKTNQVIRLPAPPRKK